ncbi:MAG: ISAzo13-like element transposase-related protein [Dermatophilaceae bacterium]
MRGNRARPVLRGGGRSNAPGLPGELVGSYKHGGQEWRPAGQPKLVKVHDFIDPHLGEVNPSGVYDVVTDTGWVGVGTDHDTSAFAVNTIRSWWTSARRDGYPHATRLLITADGGGSNGYRTRAFKTELAQLAEQTGLTIRRPPPPKEGSSPTGPTPPDLGLCDVEGGASSRCSVARCGRRGLHTGRAQGSRRPGRWLSGSPSSAGPCLPPRGWRSLGKSSGRRSGESPPARPGAGGCARLS